MRHQITLHVMMSLCMRSCSKTVETWEVVLFFIYKAMYDTSFAAFFRIAVENSDDVILCFTTEQSMPSYVLAVYQSTVFKL